MSEINRPNSEFKNSSEENQITIESYDSHASEYINVIPGEVTGGMKEWLDASVEGLPKDARMLEIGSASGRDAAYLENMGYSVQRTDATPSFVKGLREQGFDAQQLNAITDELPQNLDYVVANAVLLHFKREEAADVMEKIHGALNENGTFAFGLIHGEGEEFKTFESGMRAYFCYWTEPELRTILEEVGFNDINITPDSKGFNANPDAPWLQIIAKKGL